MIVKTLQNIYKETLFLNSVYLIFATAVLAVCGFFFWLITARLFSTEDIGLATTLISVMSFITYLSLIGFNVAFVRFLPESKRMNDEVNTGMVLVGLAAGALGIGFIALIGTFSPALDFIRGNIFVAGSFVAFCIFSALNTLTDSFFLAVRQTKYTLIINTLFSAVRIALPFAFIGWGALGVFAAAALAQAIGFSLSVLVMVWKFNYRPRLIFYREVLSEVWRYCAGNYAASIFNLLPVAVLPLLIINNLGAESAAYYYIVTMIANMLYVIPVATTRSLFAEGASDVKTIGTNIRKSIFFMGAFLGPTLVVLLVGAPAILHIFGENYAAGGASLLRVLVLASLFIGASSILNVLFQIRKNVRAVVVVNICYSATILILAPALISYGLIGIGIAWTLGCMVATLVGFVLYARIANPYAFIDEMLHFEWVRLSGALVYLKRRLQNRGEPITILCYPNKPKPYNALYSLSRHLGYRIINDPTKKFDIVMAFEDTTVRSPNPTLEALARDRWVINVRCQDITKRHVGEMFEKVFGYGTTIDPRHYQGPCVKKSDLNAVHDGQVIECPCEPEEGYIYQKLIDNRHGTDSVFDIRTAIMGPTIVATMCRYRSLYDRFDNTKRVESRPVDEVYSKEEQRLILKFCKEFGLDYGELDVLRDKDGRLYIVDVNSHTGGPRRGVHLSKRDYDALFQKFCDGFISAFISPRA